MAIDNHPAGTREKAAERRTQALELRKAGVSYRTIGAKLGISEAQAHRDVQSALKRLAEQEQSSAADLRQMELERLDTALLAVAPAVQKGDLGAVQAWIKISESRRKLLGLDMPLKVAQTNPDGTQVAYHDLRAVVLNILAPYPEARVLLAEKLVELETTIDADNGDELAP